LKSKLTPVFINFIACVFIIGCKNSNKEAQENRLCFRNEHPYQATPTLKDVEELNLAFKNDKVTGTYNWLPAEKDKRVGYLKGSIENNVIEALYTFKQEGKEDTAYIKIVLEDNKAFISGGKPELGLNTSISKVNCKLKGK
jgi:hypothetical protein